MSTSRATSPSRSRWSEPARRRVWRAALGAWCALLAAAAPARATLSEVILAHRLLADIAEPRVLRMDFRADAAGEPATVYGVAFSFEGLWWLYAGEIGTRILGPAAPDWPAAAEFTRRLRQIDPAIERVTIHPQPVAPPRQNDQVQLNNACVIASISALAAVLVRQADIHEAGLVLLSYDTADASTSDALFVNHCLLVYRERERWQCIDPRTPQNAFALERIAIGAPLDPMLLRLSLQARYPLKSARLLPLGAGTLRRIGNSAVWRATAALRLESP